MKNKTKPESGNAPEQSGPSGAVPPRQAASAGQPVASDGPVPAAAAAPAESNESGLDAVEPEIGFPKADLNLVQKNLADCSKSESRFALSDMLTAGIATGVRPGEWKATWLEINDDDSATDGCLIRIYVLDPDRDELAGNGIRRTIDMSDFDGETVLAAIRMSELGETWFEAGEFKQRELECGRLLEDVCGNVFGKAGMDPGKSYSFGSLRRQFVVNLLSVKDLEEAGTLAGRRLFKESPENSAKIAKAWEAKDLRNIAAALGAELKAHRMANRRKDRHAAGLAAVEAA